LSGLPDKPAQACLHTPSVHHLKFPEICCFLRDCGPEGLCLQTVEQGTKYSSGQSGVDGFNWSIMHIQKAYNELIPETGLVGIPAKTCAKT